MNKEFCDTLSDYLRKNTKLSDKEISVASSFLAALTVTPTHHRYAALRIMLQAIELIEKVANSEISVDDAIIEFDLN